MARIRRTADCELHRLVRWAHPFGRTDLLRPQLHDELQSLEGAGIERLGPPSIVNEDGKHADLALELRRLSKSLLLNFLEWMGAMSSNPQKVSPISHLRLDVNQVCF